jgi:hypothetical protein
MSANGATFLSDTHGLALLIEERDEILENLEVAETRYISSFKISTPDPSIADLDIPVPPPSEEEQSRPHISRPRALGGTVMTSIYLRQSLGLIFVFRETAHANGDTIRRKLTRLLPLRRSWPHRNITNCAA